MSPVSTCSATSGRSFVEQIEGPVLLAGHSYGGAVITDAATGNAHVKALVYDDAYIPALGENVTTLSTAQYTSTKATYQQMPKPSPPT